MSAVPKPKRKKNSVNVDRDGGETAERFYRADGSDASSEKNNDEGRELRVRTEILIAAISNGIYY